jgi:hypothetical protein
VGEEARGGCGVGLAWRRGKRAERAGWIGQLELNTWTGLGSARVGLATTAARLMGLVSNTSKIATRYFYLISAMKGEILRFS